MIEIKDLYVNFYTQSGVVKALDGVNITIYQGETLGLVGETGCGKSVTANCILRLIPQPPGKIEKGNIYFLKPEGTKEELEEIRAKIEEIKTANPSIADNDPKLAALNEELAESEKRGKLVKERDDLVKGGAGPEDPRVKAIEGEIEQMDSRYDLMKKSKDYMQKIRGKYISMIFQEPMSALNPVFKVGDQISEIMLLHDKKELSLAVVATMEQRLRDLKQYRHVRLVPNAKDEFKCSKCGAIVVDREAEKCPGCNGFFKTHPLRGLETLAAKNYLKTYRSYSKNPNAVKFKVMSKIPLVKRYERPLKAEAYSRSKRMLRLVKIPDPDIVVNSYPFELSGGMQQRVMIAMALACRPQLLIADEPTTALDVTIQAQILKLMKDLQKETGTSILMITHNLGIVADICDRVGVMYAGTIAEIGLKHSIFKEPFHPYTQGLMNSIPKVNVDVARLDTIEGTVPNLITPPTGCRFHPRCPYAMPICSVEKPKLIEIRKDHSVACHLYNVEEA